MSVHIPVSSMLKNMSCGMINIASWNLFWGIHMTYWYTCMIKVQHILVHDVFLITYRPTPPPPPIPPNPWFECYWYKFVYASVWITFFPTASVCLDVIYSSAYSERNKMHIRQAFFHDMLATWRLRLSRSLSSTTKQQENTHGAPFFWLNKYFYSQAGRGGPRAVLKLNRDISEKRVRTPSCAECIKNGYGGRWCMAWKTIWRYRQYSQTCSKDHLYINCL